MTWARGSVGRSTGGAGRGSRPTKTSGRPDASSAPAAIAAIRTATADVVDGLAAALVTNPVVRDPSLVEKLLSLHRALERAPRGLASDDLLIEWIEATAGVPSQTRSFDTARRDLALRRLEL